MAVTPAGSTIGVTYRVYQGAKLVAVGQPAPRLQVSQPINFVASFKPAAGATYAVNIDAGDISGNHQLAKYTLVMTRKAAAA